MPIFKDIIFDTGVYRSDYPDAPVDIQTPTYIVRGVGTEFNPTANLKVSSTHTASRLVKQSTYTPESTRHRKFIEDRFIFINDGRRIDGDVIELGLVAGDITLNYGVWNNYDDPKLVTSMTVTEGSGVEILTDLTGQSFNPREEKSIQVKVILNGPPILDATISMVISGDPFVYTTRLSGIRVALPYLLEAEWETGMSMTRRYSTTVFKAGTEAETRAALRITPTRQVNAKLFFQGDKGMAQAYSALAQVSNSQFLMPYVPDLTKTSGDVQYREIPCDTSQRRFCVGCYALIVRYGEFNSITRTRVSTSKRNSRGQSWS